MKKITTADLSPVTNLETLVVASKTKAYVKARVPGKGPGANTLNVSDTVFEPLSAHLREVLDRALVLAVNDGRKTVLARDVEAAVTWGVDPLPEAE